MTIALHFQARVFLADYAAMQQAPTILSSGAAESPADAQLTSTIDLANNDPPQLGVLATSTAERPVELGGRDGPEPTRFGDWEKAGRCIDF